MTLEQIQQKLEERFPHSHIEVADLTGTQDHYQVLVRSKAFKGLSRLQQQRVVMDVFDQELKSGELHALAIKTISIED